MWVSNHNTTQCHNPEELDLYLHCRANLETYNVIVNRYGKSAQRFFVEMQLESWIICGSYVRFHWLVGYLYCVTY